MTKLEKLIKELCPNGVGFKRLKDCSIMERGTAITQKQIQQGNIPVIAGGKKPAYYCDKFNREGETITVAGSGAYAGYLAYWNKPIFVSDAFSIKGQNGVLTKYLYYCLDCKQIEIYNTKKGDGVPHVHISSIECLQIPLPPLAVQCEIVRILDDYTERVKILQCKLQEELGARQKQQKYYRDKLLSFDKLNSEYNVRWLRIGDVCAVFAGGDVPKDFISSKQSSEYPIPIISNGIGANAIYGYTSNAKIAEPAVTVAARGTIGYAEYRDYPYYPIIRLLTCIPLDTNKLNTKYLYYCLQGKQYQVPTGGIPQLIAPELKKVQIPVPPLEVQEKIVETLDHFDALCNDLSEGLPTEIEARQKQYEYYRDKLLSFKEYV